MLHKTVFYAIGLMSGSSLDGLDICYVRFNISDGHFDYEILHADCIEYTDAFRTQLKNAPQLSGFNLSKLHVDLGKYFGTLTHHFIQENKIEQLDFICSHGQTIFHQPNIGFTTQIGCGAAIAAQTGCKVVSDLRTADVAYNGQGAPIVPITERFLFPDYSVFLNLGGIANIAVHTDNTVAAFDVCAANTMLNYIAHQLNKVYDEDGKIARGGKIHSELLQQLNAIEYCHQKTPKSLGTEHVYSQWIPLFDSLNIPSADKMATAVEHIALQLNCALEQYKNIRATTLFLTGGGALNTFLVERIQHRCSLKVIVPDVLTVQYKEALAMAFFGLLRILEIPNCLSSVTGAQKDVIGGAVYLP